jgi:hypothetical protein
MTFEEALTARVLRSPLALRLAPWEGTRAVHWGDRPDGAGLAAIVFNIVVGGTGYSHAGRDDLRIALVQADALARDYSSARAIGDELGQMLEQPSFIEGLHFTHGFIDREADIPVVGVRGSQSVYGRSLRLSIYCKE